MEPSNDCERCPRLATYRRQNRASHPDWFNAPVPCFGPRDAPLLITGLAPGRAGANRTGRPFTGDGAGELLFATLSYFGLGTGDYDRRADDGYELRGCRIVNAVRCVPPGNRPTAGEIAACREFLVAEIASMPRLRVILALGRIAHDSVVRALGARPSVGKFAHAARHRMAGITLYDSYHCSRYNTNTRRLTPEMFREVFTLALAELEASDPDR